MFASEDCAGLRQSSSSEIFQLFYESKSVGWDRDGFEKGRGGAACSPRLQSQRHSSSLWLTQSLVFLGSLIGLIWLALSTSIRV